LDTYQKNFLLQFILHITRQTDLINTTQYSYTSGNTPTSHQLSLDNTTYFKERNAWCCSSRFFAPRAHSLVKSCLRVTSRCHRLFTAH